MNKAVYYCPAVTCFDKDRELDPEAQKNVYRHVLAGGIEGLIIMGSIGGLSNLYPEVAAAAAKAFNAGDFAECERLQKKLNKLFQLYAISDPFHPVMKRAMMLRGIDMQPYCCEPMPLATDEQAEKVKALLAEVDTM